MTHTATHWLLYFLMLAIGATGLFLNLLGLFGLWLLLAGYAIYAWLTGWNVYVGWPSLGTLLGLAIFAELAEFFAGAAGSSAAGGRKRGALGAIVGALVGAIGFSFIPVPVISTIAGACIGAFVGASLAEFFDRDWRHAVRVGYGAAKGRFYGIVIKSVIGILMLLITLFAGLPF